MTFCCKIIRFFFCCCCCCGWFCPKTLLFSSNRRRKRNPENLPLLMGSPGNTGGTSNPSNIPPVEPKAPPKNDICVFHQFASPPGPILEDFGLVGFQNGYFVYGGAYNRTKVDKSEVRNKLFFFDPYTPTFHVIEDDASVIHGRYGHTAFLRKNRYLVIFGGFTQQKNHEYDPNLYEYDILNKKWETYRFRPMYSKNMSQSDLKLGMDDLYRQNQPKNAAPRLFHHTSLYAGFKDEMYVFGGRSGTYTQMNKLFRYSFQERRWKELVFLKKSDIPEARDRHTMNWIDAVQTKFLIFGGMTSSFAPTNDTWVFSLSEKKWSFRSCFGRRPSPRYSHASVVHNRRLYIYGGESVSDVHRDLFELNLLTNEWRQYELPSHVSVKAHHKISFFRNNHGNWRLLSIGGCDRRRTVGQTLEISLQRNGLEEARRKRFLFLIGGAFFDTVLHLPLKKERIRCFRSLFASSVLRLQDINQITLSQNNLLLNEEVMLSVLLGMDEMRGTFLSLDGSQNPDNLPRTSTNNNSGTNSVRRRRKRSVQKLEDKTTVKENETVVEEFQLQNPMEEQSKHASLSTQATWEKNEEDEGEEEDEDKDLEHQAGGESFPLIVVDNEVSSDEYDSGNEEEGEDDDDEVEEIGSEYIIQSLSGMMYLSDPTHLKSEDRLLYPPAIYFFDLFLFFRQFEMPAYMDLVLKRVRQLRHIPTLLKLFQRSLNETKRRKEMIKQNSKLSDPSRSDMERNQLKFEKVVDMEVVTQSKFSIAVFEAIKEQYPQIRQHRPYQDFLRNLNYFEEMEDFLLHHGSVSLRAGTDQDASGEGMGMTGGEASELKMMFTTPVRGGKKKRKKKKKSQGDERSVSVRNFKGSNGDEEGYNIHNNIRPKGFFDLFMWNCRVLYEKKFKYSNVKLSTSEGFEYVAHMEVLIMRSQYFCELFRKNIRRVRERKFGVHVLVRVREISSGELQLLLQWIYLDEIRSEEMARLFLLLRFSEQYEEMELRSYLMDRITEIVVREGKKFLKKEVIKKLGYFFNSGLLSPETSEEFLKSWEHCFKLKRKKILKSLKKAKKKVKGLIE